jgi:hypothetical protein
MVKDLQKTHTCNEEGATTVVSGSGPKKMRTALNKYNYNCDYNNDEQLKHLQYTIRMKNRS